MRVNVPSRLFRYRWVGGFFRFCKPAQSAACNKEGVKILIPIEVKQGNAASQALESVVFSLVDAAIENVVQAGFRRHVWKADRTRPELHGERNHANPQSDPQRSRHFRGATESKLLITPLQGERDFMERTHQGRSLGADSRFRRRWILSTCPSCVRDSFSRKSLYCSLASSSSPSCR